MLTNSSAAPRDPQRLRARASLRFLGQPIQRPSLKVPSTLGPQSRSARATRKISSRADASTHRHRYHPVPSLPKGNSGLFCQPAYPRTMGFFVMIDQRTKHRAFASLCAGAHASVRPVLLPLVLLWRFATRLQPIVASKTARCSHDQPCLSLYFAQSHPNNPHRQTSLLHPTL